MSSHKDSEISKVDSLSSKCFPFYTKIKQHQTLHFYLLNVARLVSKTYLIPPFPYCPPNTNKCQFVFDLTSFLLICGIFFFSPTSLSYYIGNNWIRATLSLSVQMVSSCLDVIRSLCQCHSYVDFFLHYKLKPLAYTTQICWPQDSFGKLHDRGKEVTKTTKLLTKLFPNKVTIHMPQVCFQFFLL